MQQDLKDLLSIFNAENVEYLIVGGYAVIKYTEPRYTKDLDLWVNPDRQNAERVFNALRRFGAPLTGLSPSDFTQEGYFYTMGMPPLRVDIVFGLKGLDFNECWDRRVDTLIGEIAAHVISAEDLIVNKEAVGRHQDLADAEKLREALQRQRD